LDINGESTVSLDSTKEVGKIIGNTISELDNTKANLTASDSSGQFNFEFQDNFRINGEITLTKKEYANDSFIIDHPIQGEIDSGIDSSDISCVSFYTLDDTLSDLKGLGTSTNSGGYYTTAIVLNGLAFTTSAAGSYLNLGSASTYSAGTLTVGFWAYIPDNFTGELFRCGNVSIRYYGGVLIYNVASTNYDLTSDINVNEFNYFYLHIVNSSTTNNLYINTYTPISLFTMTNISWGDIIFNNNSTYTNTGNYIYDSIVIMNTNSETEFNTNKNFTYTGFKIDGGYKIGSLGALFPWTFPVSFSTGVSSILYSTTY